MNPKDEIRQTLFIIPRQFRKDNKYRINRKINLKKSIPRDKEGIPP